MSEPRENGTGVELVGINVLATNSSAVDGSVNRGYQEHPNDTENTSTSNSVPHQENPDATSSPLQQDDADVEKYDDDDDDDDVTGTGCLFIDHVTGCRAAVSAFYARHKSIIKICFLVLLVALYAAYFAYALYYEFGSEGSVRLLWVTCLVVVLLALSLLCRCLRPQLVALSKTKPMSYIRHHQRRVNWIVLAVLYAFLIIFVVVDITVTTKNYYNFVSLSGILVYVLLMFMFSVSPRKVNWQTVLWGFGLQFIFALIVLRWPAGYEAFKWLGDRVSEFLAYSDAGAEFVFGASFRDHLFAFQVLPVIIFFSSVVSVLFYWGALQYVIRKVAWVMQVTMATTAAESLNAAANVFVGQTEAPLLIRPLLPAMSRSEIHAVMTGGFATIAGGVLAAYILFGVPANHLLSASFMSAPAALAVSKILYPETKKSHTNIRDIKTMAKGTEVNFIEAAASGAVNAISLVANVAANLIAFIALLEFVNTTLTWFGHRVGIEELTFQSTACSLFSSVGLGVSQYFFKTTRKTTLRRLRSEDYSKTDRRPLGRPRKYTAHMFMR